MGSVHPNRLGRPLGETARNPAKDHLRYSDDGSFDLRCLVLRHRVLMSSGDFVLVLNRLRRY